MSVFTLVDWNGQVQSVHATLASAELRMSELVAQDKKRWFEAFGDLDGRFDNYSIDEWEVN